MQTNIKEMTKYDWKYYRVCSVYKLLKYKKIGKKRIFMDESSLHKLCLKLLYDKWGEKSAIECSFQIWVKDLEYEKNHCIRS